MILIQVMSISSVILGVYILGIVLFGSSEKAVQKQQFHLGCYLVQQNLSYSWMISSSLSKIKSNTPNLLSSLLYSVSSDLIDSRAYNVAAALESYLRQEREQKQNMSNYFSLAKATKEAEEEYISCSIQVLRNPFSPQKCFSDWSKLGNCSFTLDILRNQLKALLQQKDQIEGRMKAELFKTKSDPKKEHSSQYKRMHKEKDRELEIEQRNLEMSLKVIHEKLVNARYNLGVSENETLNSKHLYRECTQHRYEFQLCQQMSQQIKNLGHGSFENLSEKMEKKRGYIIRIQGMLADNSKTERQQLFSLHNRSLNEYRKLHKIFAEIKAKIDKNCGCSQGEEQKLYQILQSHMREQKQLRNQVLALEEGHIKANKQLSTVKERRRLLYSDLEKKQQIKSKQVVEEINTFEVLKSLQQQQIQINSMIINYESKFSKLAADCESRRWNMYNLISQVQQINNCRGKKDYFMKLKSSLTRERQKLSISTTRKQKLVQLVKQFNI